ncbi:MAG: NADH-quinone oxidoreductase subunit F, partial [candidate division Zixibacteria bacterium]
MISFETRKLQAQKRWDELQASRIPVIYIGAATCGMSAGSMKVLEAVQKTLKANKLKAKIVKVGCIGPCYMEPLMDIQMPDQPRICYANVSEENARKIIESYLIDGNPLPEMAVGHFGENGHPVTDGIPKFFEIPMLKPQTRLVLRNCGLIDPEDIDHYLANDGYEGLRNALSKTPEEVIEMVGEAGLRGRGGAGFPTYKKWEICRSVESDQKYMICNVSEGDPGAFMNRALIEGDPHCVLEGLIIASYAIGASHGYVYINSDYYLAVSRLKQAAKQMRECGLLGKNILGSGFDFELTIKESAGAFV